MIIHGRDITQQLKQIISSDTIDINSKQSIKSRSTFKAEVNIGIIAKFSAEVEQTKEGATCISVKNNISFSGHMLPNYETYSSQHVSSIPLKKELAE